MNPGDNPNFSGRRYRPHDFHGCADPDPVRHIRMNPGDNYNFSSSRYSPHNFRGCADTDPVYLTRRNPGDNYNFSSRRYRPHNFRGCADPYPVHHNMFIQQHLDQERRRQTLQEYNLRQFNVSRPDMNYVFNYAVHPYATQNVVNPDYPLGHPGISYTRIRISAPVVLVEMPSASASAFGSQRQNEPNNNPSAGNEFNQENVRSAPSVEEILQLCSSLYASDDDANDSCTICITNFICGQWLRRLPCNHKFHAICIAPWFERTTVCPLCRADITDANAEAAQEEEPELQDASTTHLPTQNIDIVRCFFPLSNEAANNFEISSESENDEEIATTQANEAQQPNMSNNKA